MATLIIANEEINKIIKIVKSLGDAGLLINGVSKTIENEAKGTFLGNLLGNLAK